MKRMYLVVLVLSSILAAVAAHAATKIVWEAETCATIAPSMTKTATTTASGGYYIGIPLARPHGDTEGAPKDTGNATYRIRIPVQGIYQFWGRCWWTDGCGNSFFLKIGSKPAAVLGQDGTYGRWHWVKGPKVSLMPGQVTIVIQNREDGSKIDQALLTTDSRYVPVRIETPTSG